MADTAVDTNRLPISILNYFAAFTETRFNFRTLINYRWTNAAGTNDEKIRQKAFREGTRKYNRAVRKEIENILIDLQDKRKDRLKQVLGIEHLPASIFNPMQYLNKHFDAFQLIAGGLN